MGSESEDPGFALALLKSVVWPTSGPHVLFLGCVYIRKALGTIGR